MAIVYRKNILKALKKKGYSTARLRKEKILSESVIQSLRDGKYISLMNIDRICQLLDCEIEDIVKRVDEDGRDRQGNYILSYKQFDDDDN
ncbi:helix-turn-helix transcriptional regulator [Faecalibacterium sp. An192]|uniref:helix-turn-helix domain-containing protein n=1 Tax=Faecalibacterium sp. An192 TaxID=1965581 RepID=UPI000B39D2C4|nr:helix-turn-helix transcriptional regulator [Faecalibacterium sp. An192]OUP25900.1 hypothetical protein B5F27_15455 [Faecalibacterium sp. An192]